MQNPLLPLKDHLQRLQDGLLFLGATMGEMDSAKLVKAALQDKPKGFLEARHSVFVADIQRMPALVSKLFAIPAMRDYNYRVLLDRDSRVVPRYPGAEEKVLWLQLDNGRLVAQREFASATDLRDALEKAATP